MTSVLNGFYDFGKEHDRSVKIRTVGRFIEVAAKYLLNDAEMMEVQKRRGSENDDYVADFVLSKLTEITSQFRKVSLNAPWERNHDASCQILKKVIR